MKYIVATISLILLSSLYYTCVVDRAIPFSTGVICEYQPEPEPRSPLVDGQPSLVIAVTTDDGTSAYTADYVKGLLQDTVRNFWSWHTPTNSEYDSVMLVNWTAGGTPPPSGTTLTDWIEQNITFPVIDSLNSVYPEITVPQDFWQVFVLMPSRVQGYGWEGFYNALQIGVNTSATESRLPFILAHEVGHGYYLGHSKRQLYRNCVFESSAEYGGDDIMGGTNFFRLNAHNQKLLGILSATNTNLSTNQWQVYWVDPVDEAKTAIRLGSSSSGKYLYYRARNNRGQYTDFSNRRYTQPARHTAVRSVSITVDLEGRTNEAASYTVKASKADTLIYEFVHTAPASGVFSVVLPCTDLSLTVDAPQYLAKNVTLLSGNNTASIQLFCGDCNNSESVTSADYTGLGLCDINLDGLKNGIDVALAQANTGKVSAVPPGKYYTTNDYHKVIVGQPAWVYLAAGIDPATLFLGAVGTPTENSLWIWVKKGTTCP